VRIFPWAGATGAVAVIPEMWPLFLVFLRIGSIVFGSGYVLLAFLRADLVVHRAWVTDAQLVDAVAIGQVTPGPVFHHGHFPGLLVARTSWRAGGHNWNFSSRVYPGGRERAFDPSDSAFGNGWCISGRCECGIAGVDGLCQLRFGSFSYCRFADHWDCDCQRGFIVSLSYQFGVAGARRGCHWNRCSVNSWRLGLLPRKHFRLPGLDPEIDSQPEAVGMPHEQ